MEMGGRSEFTNAIETTERDLVTGHRVSWIFYFGLLHVPRA